jgi:hypothetical protein
MSESFISVGGLVKKLLAINPKLDSGDLMAIVRHCTRVVPAQGERRALEVLDEAKAIALVESTVRKNV